jgi:hypothetical protein
MRITDYEKGHSLRDICIALTRDEAEDLAAYLNKLLQDPAVNRVYVSEIVNSKLDKEITIAVDASHRASNPFKTVQNL